jgi:hypothetical protein
MDSAYVCAASKSTGICRPGRHYNKRTKYLDSVIWVDVVRAPPKANMFTPKNEFEHGKFYSVNVPEMAEYTGAQPLLVEQTFGMSSMVHICFPAVYCNLHNAEL